MARALTADSRIAEFKRQIEMVRRDPGLEEDMTLPKFPLTMVVTYYDGPGAQFRDAAGVVAECFGEDALISRMTKDAEAIAEQLRAFSVSDDLLLSPESMAPYSENWVAALHGAVVAHAPDLGSLMERLHAAEHYLPQVAIRFIGKDGEAV